MQLVFKAIFTLFAVSATLSAQHKLSVMPFPYAALEPYIDSTTMNIHHNNHQGAQVNNLNVALSKYPALFQKSLEEIFRNMDEIPDDIFTSVRNNGGGHWNHDLFWQILTPAGKSKMTPAVQSALEKNFGSVEKFKEAFERAAATRVGSGWVWLIKDANGRLKITSTPNQDNPLMSFIDPSERGKPVLALDVWEHAYYLKYQWRRAEYVKNFWNIVNWSRVEALLK